MSADLTLVHPIRTGEFIDSNVLVYAYDTQAGTKHEKAKELIRSRWKLGSGRVSIQVLQEFYVIATRKIAKPLSSQVAAQVVADFGQWQVFTPTVQDIEEAIRFHQRYQISFWDALILHGAARLGCKVVWSEDLNAGQTYEGVMVQNPFGAV
jgi:predicted nucleic acid-binding protein